MNNQAAQTMPELPPSFARVHNDGYWTLRVRDTAEFIVHDSRQTPAQEVYSSDQMRDMYQQGYAAALSKTAGVADGWKLVPVELTNAMWTAGNQAMSTREAWRAMLAAAPAASGAHPDALPDGTLSKSTAKRVEALAGASVSERARELLATEYSKCGMQQCAADIRSGIFAAAQQLAVNAIKAALEQKVPSGEVAIVCDWKDADPFPTFIEAEIGGKSVSLEWRDRPDGLKELIVPVTDPALRAIEQALTQQRGDGEAVDRDAWAEALELPEGYTFEEFLPGGWHYAWTRADGERMVYGTTWNHPALAAIAAWQYAPATTPQPSADAVRELVKRWRDEAGQLLEDHRGDRVAVCVVDAMRSMADELESLLSAASGEKGVG